MRLQRSKLPAAMKLSCKQKISRIQKEFLEPGLNNTLCWKETNTSIGVPLIWLLLPKKATRRLEIASYPCLPFGNPTLQLGKKRSRTVKRPFTSVPSLCSLNIRNVNWQVARVLLCLLAGDRDCQKHWDQAAQAQW